MSQTQSLFCRWQQVMVACCVGTALGLGGLSALLAGAVPGAAAQPDMPPLRPQAPASGQAATPSGYAAPAKGSAGMPARTGAGFSPLGTDVRVLPIDLPTALRLVNVSNPTIALARERILEAVAVLRQAQVLWVPNLQAGPAYLRHDGLLQNSGGEVFPTSKWSYFTGGGASMALETSDALFAPLIARRLLQAQTAAAQAVTADVQLDVAVTYLELLRAYGALAIAAEALANAEEMQGFANRADIGGFGKTPADPNRAHAEVEFRRQELINAEGRVAAVSAHLTQLLLLEPTVDLRPVDLPVPITLVDADMGLDGLVATGLMNRPELAQSRFLVAAALARWRQARLGPLLPRLEVDYFAGDFGAGINDATQQFGGRGDGLAQAIWTLHNFGASDIAFARMRRAQYNESNYHVTEVQAQIAADVAAAAKLARAHRQTLAHDQQAVVQAALAWQRVEKWTREFGFRRIVKTEAIELLIAERDLHDDRLQYLSDVIDYNQAQFRLYWAMGQPPLSALPQATAVPVSVPVAPSAGSEETVPMPRIHRENP